MILTLLVVAQLTVTQPQGIKLDNSVAQITEPADIQPALGRNVYQRTYNPQNRVKVTGNYQNTLRTQVIQPAYVVLQ